MKIVILDTTFDLTVKGLYSLVRHAAILIIASRRSIVEINFAVNTSLIKICISKLWLIDVKAEVKVVSFMPERYNLQCEKRKLKKSIA